VAGIYALAAILCWYVAMIVVTAVSVIIPKVFFLLVLLETSPLGQKHRNPLANTMNQRDNTYRNLLRTLGVTQLLAPKCQNQRIVGVVGWLRRRRRGILALIPFMDRSDTTERYKRHTRQTLRTNYYLL
jgi:hypothetical protein